MKILFTFLAVGLISHSAFAATENNREMNLGTDDEIATDVPDTSALATGLGMGDSEDGAIDSAELPRSCQEIKLTETQKKSLVGLFFSARKSMIQARAALRVARLDYINGLINSDSNSVDKLSQDVSGKAAALVSVRLEANNQLIFKILTEDQRKPALRCEYQVRRLLKSRRLEKACNGINGKK